MRGAIFDLDGTIADSARDLIGSVNDLLVPRGIGPIGLEDARAAAGMGGRALIRHAFMREGWDEETAMSQAEALYPAFLAIYECRIAQETRLFEGAGEVLDALARQGWLLGVCTNKPEKLAVALLEALGIAPLFGAILGADSLAVRKPDPGHLLETARRMGAADADLLMIGDTETDVKTARAARVPCILTAFGYAPVPPETLGADAVISSFDALVETAEALLADSREASGSLRR